MFEDTLYKKIISKSPEDMTDFLNDIIIQGHTFFEYALCFNFCEFRESSYDSRRGRCVLEECYYMDESGEEMIKRYLLSKSGE